MDFKLLTVDKGRYMKKILITTIVILFIQNVSAIITYTIDGSTWDQNITYLLLNASNQDARLIVNELDITNLWINASNQDTRIISLEAGGGSELTFSDFAWVNDTSGWTATNTTVNNGNINITGELHVGTITVTGSIQSDHDINATGVICTGSTCLNSIYNKTETITRFVNRTDWTTNDNYPTACSGSLYTQGIGDTLTCTDVNTTIDSRLITTYYNVTTVNLTRATAVDVLGHTMHSDGKYDGLTYNISEVSGANGLDVRFNITGLTTINQIVIRYKTTILAGSDPKIQIWDFDDSVWEDYNILGSTTSFALNTITIYDSSEHVSGGLARVRLYKSENGNTGNTYYFDWIAAVKGFSSGSISEIDPYWTMQKPIIYANLTNLWLNASNQDTRIDVLELGGGSVFNIFWNITNGVITSNNSISGGNINVTGNITASGIVCDSVGCIGASGGSPRPSEWDTVGGIITSNNSITNGNVNVSGNLSVIGGDLDDTLLIYTNANLPTIKTIGANALIIRGDVAGNGAVNGYYRMTNYKDYAQTTMFVDSGNAFQFAKSNDTDSTFGLIGASAITDDNAPILFKPNGDADNYVIISTTGNIESVTPSTDNHGTVGTSDKTWNNIISTLINGADICLANNWCLTEYSNNGLNDVAIVTQKPTEEMIIKMSLYKYQTFDEYKVNHMVLNINNQTNETNIIYDETLTETQFNQYRNEIYIDGKLDFTLGRTVHGSLREIKSMMDRQTELITNLYDNGYLTQAQSIHLRDDF